MSQVFKPSLTSKEFIQHCKTCSLGNLCLSYGLDEAALDKFAHLKIAQKVKQAHELLYQAGNKFENLCVLRSGSIKSYRILPDGREQITGFTLPGEILGFDGIKTGFYQLNREFLETSSICEISFDQLLNLAADTPSLQHQLFCLVSEKILSGTEIDINSTALQRIAFFVLNLSKRFHKRGLAATEFALPMSRQDIGNYLGLATETVSRLFSQLQDQKIIAVERRQLQILNLTGLQQLANQA